MKPYSVEQIPLSLDQSPLIKLEGGIIPEDVLNKYDAYKNERDLKEEEFRKNHPHEALSEEVIAELMEKYGLTGALEPGINADASPKPLHQ